MRRLLLVVTTLFAALLSIGCQEDAGFGATFDKDCDFNPIFEADGGERVYTFTTDNAWRVIVSEECDWVIVDPAAGNSKNCKFTLRVKPNQLGEDRTTELTVLFGDGASYDIPVKQKMRLRFDVEKQQQYLIDAEGGELNIDIATNIEYDVRVTYGTGWVHLAKTRAMRNETLSFTFDPNTLNRSRYATIKAVDSEDNVLYDFTFVQAAMGDAINEISYTTESGNPIDLATTLGFGTEFLTHVYQNGKGRIVFYSDITALPDRCFADQRDLTSITLPEAIVSIGNEAFSGCKGLSTMSLPASVKSIGSAIFNGCSLSELTANCTIPDQTQSTKDEEGNKIITEIPSTNELHWLYGSSITHMNINGKVGRAAMLAYTPLTSLEVEANATIIGINAFAECANLESVNAESLEQWCRTDFGSLGGNPASNAKATLYLGGTALTELNIESGISSISMYAFAGYAKLESISLGDCVKSIGAGCFEGCNVESITLGKNITSMGRHAFNGCSCNRLTINYNTPKFTVDTTKETHWLYNIKATDVVFGDEVETIGVYALGSLTSMKNLTLGSNVKYIKEGAFALCSALEQVTFKGDVETLGPHVFFECKSLKEITLPESVTTIEEYAFHKCSSLSEIYCMPTTPPTLGRRYVFDEEATIYVPEAAYDTYCSSESWVDYANNIVRYSF